MGFSHVVNIFGLITHLPDKNQLHYPVTQKFYRETSKQSQKTKFRLQGILGYFFCVLAPENKSYNHTKVR